MTRSSRALAAGAGLLGAAGVALAAAASHLAGAAAGLGTAALLLAIHGAALIGLAALSERAPGRAGLLGPAGAVVALGSALFAADLAARAFLGERLFPAAAPTGGLLMIAGWLAVAAVAAFARDPV